MTLQFQTTLVALIYFLLLLFSFYVWNNLDSLRINDKNEKRKEITDLVPGVL